ncbi:hypothetical protein [Microvirga sp. 2TAF3]|uniref:hypothetical protein n=1 Tax=Microvirga sp. 2TAF3 TaxID=3233014 RepID=UPI003F9D9213
MMLVMDMRLPRRRLVLNVGAQWSTESREGCLQNKSQNGRQNGGADRMALDPGCAPHGSVIYMPAPRMQWPKVLNVTGACVLAKDFRIESLPTMFGFKAKRPGDLGRHRNGASDPERTDDVRQKSVLPPLTVQFERLAA